MRATRIALLLAAGQFCVFSQSTGQLHEQLRVESQKRIADLYRQIKDSVTISPAEKQLAEACATVSCDHAGFQVGDESRKAGEHRMATMNRLIAQIHGEVDAYISRTVRSPAFDSKIIALELREILSGGNTEPPSTFALDSAKGSSLFVVYALHKADLMGPQATSVTIRAYNATNRQFRFADSTGADMEGYGNILVRELPSPVPDEKWLLVWGQMTGANGPNIRMRVYEYDGEKFRTMWMPENSWGSFSVDVTAHGFTVNGSYYREHGARHDAYFLAADGLYRQND